VSCAGPRPPCSRPAAHETASRGGDEGFGLIEVMIAMVILAIVVLAVTRAAVGAESGATLAQQETVANALASEAVAQVEALPYADLAAGLNPAVDDLALSPYVSATGSGSSASYVLTLNNEQILTDNSATDGEAPLVPFTSTDKLGISYTVSSFPTIANGATGANGVITVTVIVSWTSPVSHLPTDLVSQVEVSEQ
jgi:prepilin-type N-terminal cleavage/methylation domain-containing protein